MSGEPPPRPDGVSDEQVRAMRRAARQLRLTVVEMIHRAGSGHTGGSLSAAEILTVLYDAVMRIRPDQPDWPLRDRLLLSKGHAAPALYAALARKGYFDPRWLSTLRRIDAPLQGHPSMRDTPGVEMSTGSLGMGLSVGVGMALAGRRSTPRAPDGSSSSAATASSRKGRTGRPSWPPRSGPCRS